MPKSDERCRPGGQSWQGLSNTPDKIDRKFPFCHLPTGREEGTACKCLCGVWRETLLFHAPVGLFLFQPTKIYFPLQLQELIKNMKNQKKKRNNSICLRFIIRRCFLWQFQALSKFFFKSLDLFMFHYQTLPAQQKYAKDCFIWSLYYRGIPGILSVLFLPWQQSDNVLILSLQSATAITQY